MLTQSTRRLEYYTDDTLTSRKGSLGLTYDTAVSELDQSNHIFQLTGATVTKKAQEFVGGGVTLQVESLAQKHTWFRAFAKVCTVEAYVPALKHNTPSVHQQGSIAVADTDVVQLWTWGANEKGQLAIKDKSTTGRAVPQLVTSLQKKFMVRQVSIGRRHAACVAVDDDTN